MKHCASSNPLIHAHSCASRLASKPGGPHSSKRFILAPYLGMGSVWVPNFRSCSYMCVYIISENCGITVQLFLLVTPVVVMPMTRRSTLFCGLLPGSSYRRPWHSSGELRPVAQVTGWSIHMSLRSLDLLGSKTTYWRPAQIPFS